MKLIPLSDGTYMKQSRPMEGVPFLSDWHKALLLRHAAFWTQKRNRHTGHEERVIMPYDRNQEQACELQEGGTVGIYCIHCAVPTPKLDLNRIRIGGVVQMPQDEQCNDIVAGFRVTILRRWRRQPVRRGGWGCPACTELYMAEAARVAADNANRSAYIECLRQIYINKGDWHSASQVQPAKQFEPFLDVLSSDVPLYQMSEAQEATL